MLNMKIKLIVVLILLLFSISSASASFPDTAIHKIPSNNPVIDRMVLVEGNPNTMSANVQDGRLYINDQLHTTRWVKLNEIELWKNVRGFNGYSVSVTHISDSGKVTHWIQELGKKDNNGYFTIELKFSEIIIDGFTGYTMWTVNNQSGNWTTSFTQNNASTVIANVTGYRGGFLFEVPFNTTATALMTDMQHELNQTNFQLTADSFNKIGLDGNGKPIINVTYSNGAQIPFWVDYWNNVSSYRLITKSDYTISDNQRKLLIGGNNATTSASDMSVTFNYSSDFNDLTQWTQQAGAWSTVGGYLKTPNAAGLNYLRFNNAFGFDDNYIIEQRFNNSGGAFYSGRHVSNSDNPLDFTVGYQFFASIANDDIRFYVDGALKTNPAVNINNAQYYRSKTIINSTGDNEIYLYSDSGVLLQSGTTTDDSAGANKNFGYFAAGTDDRYYVDYVTIRRNTPNNVVVSVGAETTSTGESQTFILTVNGTSDSQTVIVGNMTNLSVSPISANSILLNTVASDWTGSITAFHSKDTTKISETSNSGFSNMSINFTPLDAMTTGTINGTFATITFSNHDYIGSLNVSIDGVYTTNATRNGQIVSIPVYNLDETEHNILISIPYNPSVTLYDPIDTALLNYSYPPLTHDVNLSWSSTTGTYKYTVYEDSVITKTGTVSTNSTTVSLPAGVYTWIVNGYDDIFNEYSVDSETFEFTVETTTTYENTTGIHGVVYYDLIGTETPLSTVVVSITNDTWSSSALTGIDGYYTFTGLKAGTYILSASKDRFYGSLNQYVTTVSKNMTEHNIRLIENTGTDYDKHNVKFIVKSLWGTPYSGVGVEVFIYGNDNVYLSGTTGTDGSVAFELNEYQEYRITFEKTSQSIDIEIKIYPKDDSYTVYVDIGTMIDDLLNPDDEDQEITAIDVSISKTIINDNTANITVNYNDIMDETSGLTLTLSQSIDGNITNNTILATTSLGTINNTEYNFTVSNYNGESYFITITATHTTHGSISRLYGVQFENTATQFGFAGEVVGWLAIIFLMWFSLTATQATVPHTAIGVCALATVLMALGWGQYLSTAGLALAWIMSLAANFAVGKEASS